MATEISRNAQFIAKLIELSSRGKIGWKPHERGGYVAEVFGKKLRALSVREPPPEWMAPTPGLLSVEKPILEVIDHNGKTGYVFKDIAGLGNLVHIASYHSSEVAELMDQVLAS